MRLFYGFTAFWLTAGLVCPAAMAKPFEASLSSQPSQVQAAPLMPLEARALGHPQDNNDLNAVADQINDGFDEDGDNQAQGLLNPQNIPIVRDMLDEEGNVNLPLGVRVYDTMGDMSVGFGSDF
ncbi:hypothetical protein C7271_01090 [filamentous cyanobacterium CCP5]|nr:hypothetical protein C7271_01090 [filamentous cyanobacterium CCP5]